VCVVLCSFRLLLPHGSPPFREGSVQTNRDSAVHYKCWRIEIANISRAARWPRSTIFAIRIKSSPGVFTVERHVRGKWACAKCQTLIQAPVPAQIIDKGMPTAGLLAQLLVAKYADHMPLYRRESIFARAGMPLARSTLAEWVGARADVHAGDSQVYRPVSQHHKEVPASRRRSAALRQRESSRRLDTYAKKLATWLAIEASKSRKQRRNLRQIHTIDLHRLENEKLSASAS
jgi:transposase